MSEHAKANLKRWFFHHCNPGTRRNLFAAFDLPLDEITSHGTEELAFAHILALIYDPTPPEAPEAVSVDGVEKRAHELGFRAGVDLGLTYPQILESAIDTHVAAEWINTKRWLGHTLATPANIPADGEVEPVATAIFRADENRSGAWQARSESVRDNYRHMARAAIAALSPKQPVGRD